MIPSLVGVDLGGTRIKVAVASQDCDVLAEESVPTDSHEGPNAVITKIINVVGQLVNEMNTHVAAIGMGVPGLVDLQSGTTKFLPNLPTQWRDVPVGERLSASFGCPIRVLNDVRTATMAELQFGHGKDHQEITLAFFSLGTGIGGGVAIEGQLRLGPLGSAGELGHQTILPNGPRCGCGNQGCLEALASGPVIASEGIRLMRSGLAPTLHELVDGDADKVTTEIMARAAQDDPLVQEAIKKAATYVGIAAANVVTILHPDMIVLGGGVAELGSLLTDTVREVIRDRVGMFPTNDVQVLKSQLGERTGVLGAVALAKQAYDQNIRG